MSKHVIVIQCIDDLIHLGGILTGNVATCGVYLKKFIRELDVGEMTMFCMQFTKQMHFSCVGLATDILDAVRKLDDTQLLSFSDDEEYKEDYINYVPYVYRINILKKQLTVTVYTNGRHFMKTFTFLEFLEMHLSIVQTAIDTLKNDVVNDTILHRYIELIHSERERKRLCERGEFVRNN